MSDHGLDHDVIGFGFPEREVVAADLDFERVAERSRPDQRDPRAGEQTHFAEPEEGGSRFGKFADDGGSADGEFGQRHG